MTAQIHMPHHVILFFPGHVKEGHGIQGQSRHTPRAVGNANSLLVYAPTVVYIHMIDV
jgi:hypothetical protein